MDDFHQKTLAAYKDLASVYSYGYGALRACYGSYHDGSRDLQRFVKAAEEIISAVEFRSAEIQASALMGVEALRKDVENILFEPQLSPTSAVYETPKDADGIARDQ